jgi:chromosome segregation ATPase
MSRRFGNQVSNFFGKTSGYSITETTFNNIPNYIDKIEKLIKDADTQDKQKNSQKFLHDLLVHYKNEIERRVTYLQNKLNSFPGKDEETTIKLSSAESLLKRVNDNISSLKTAINELHEDDYYDNTYLLQQLEEFEKPSEQSAGKKRRRTRRTRRKHSKKGKKKTYRK